MQSFLAKGNIWTSLNRNLLSGTDRTEAADSLCVQCQDKSKSELLDRLDYLRDIFIEFGGDTCKMLIILNPSLASLNDLVQQREKVVIRHLKEQVFPGQSITTTLWRSLLRSLELVWGRGSRLWQHRRRAKWDTVCKVVQGWLCDVVKRMYLTKLLKRLRRHL